MSNFEIIFISGVHGVGKSSLCSRINQKFGLPFYSASSLIREVKKSEVDVNKQVVDAENNQDYLIMALDNLNPQSEKILLDGHFCLNDSDGFFDINIKTFQAMRLRSILVLHDIAEKIHQRLLKRDGKSLSAETIHSLQTRELELAKFTANELNVKLQTVSYEEALENLNWIETLL